MNSPSIHFIYIFIGAPSVLQILKLYSFEIVSKPIYILEYTFNMGTSVSFFPPSTAIMGLQRVRYDWRNEWDEWWLYALLFFLNWNITALQLVCFCCTTIWTGYIYTHIISLSSLPPDPHLLPARSSQSPKLSSVFSFDLWLEHLFQEIFPYFMVYTSSCLCVPVCMWVCEYKCMYVFHRITFHF